MLASRTVEVAHVLYHPKNTHMKGQLTGLESAFADFTAALSKGEALIKEGQGIMKGD